MNLNKSILSRGSQKVPVVCHQYQKPLAVNHDIGRVFIKDLVLGVEKNSVIGLVIAKYEARSFPDKKQPGQLKCQLSFVLRDSVEYFIYVTCWGHDTFVKAISESFKMGDTVEICNFMVQTKANTEIDLKYCPSTPSSYQITVNETHSTVSLFSGDISEFSFLASLPVVDAQDYYALGDIISCPENFNGVSVNLMAAVKDVGATKNILTKAGKHMKRRELKLFDETCVSFPLIIWDSEFAEFADSWQAKETILFLRDVKVAYEEFRQQMVASCTSKTIITTNPDTAEAQHLYSYASTVSFDETFDEMDDDVKLASIVDIYNINDLQDKLLNQENNIWYGILFAVVTSFDIDDDESKCVVTRCSSCQRRLQRSVLRCPSQSCSETFRSMTSFEIQLSLSDHTNGQSGFMLVRNVAEKVLQMDVSSFDRLSPAQKTDLKWKYLMERYKVYFKVKPTKKDAAKASITILGMEAVNPVDYIKSSR